MVCYCVWDGGGSGLHSSDVWKQLGMEHRPCTQEGGKEREGGSVELGKSEGGGGGGRGGSSQWKNCEMCLAKSGAVSFVFFSSKNNEIQISCFYLKGWDCLQETCKRNSRTLSCFKSIAAFGFEKLLNFFIDFFLIIFIIIWAGGGV